MALFVSPVSALEPILDERTADKHFADTIGAGFASGWQEDDGSDGFAAPPIPLPRELYIPRSDWAGMIEEQTRKGQLPSQVAASRGIGFHSQDRTNYCWAFGYIHAVEYQLYGVTGLDYVALSPASIAAPITNYANPHGDPAGVGGWGTRAQQYATDHGICPQRLWHRTAIDRRLDTPESRAARVKVRLSYTLRPGDFAGLMSCLLRGWPVPIGLGWWRHLVCGFDPIVRGRDAFGVRFRNSWPRYGDKGYGVLDEAKAQPNDACCPIVGAVGGNVT